MTQPIQPQQPYGQQPPPGVQPLGQPMGPPPGPQPMPLQGKPPIQKRFGFLALAIAAVVGLILGGAAFGAAGDTPTGTAAPAPTVTVTKTAPPVVEGGSEPTEAAEPEPEPEPEPTEEPAAWNPKPKDFKVGIKVTDKECFGSAGCNITYKVSLDYLGSQDLPDEGTTDITYKVSGAEDPIIGTLTIDSEGKFSTSPELASTPSSSSKLVAKVTEVDYNEFG